MRRNQGRKVRHYPQLVAAEAAIADMMATLQPEVRALLDKLPRNIEAIVASVFPVSVEYVRELTMEKIDRILRERYGAGLDPSEMDETEEVAGYVYAEPHRAVIFVEEKHGEYHTRFTLAHELAHLWLEYICGCLKNGGAGKGAWKVRDGARGIKKAVDDPESVLHDSYPANESAANAFAAALLMPREEVLRLVQIEIEGQSNYWTAIENMQPRFRTSEWALAFRLYELGKMSWEEYVQVRETVKARATGADVPDYINQDS